jgi:hypothetical protein
MLNQRGAHAGPYNSSGAAGVIPAVPRMLKRVFFNYHRYLSQQGGIGTMNKEGMGPGS